jgi:hypothetical protein
LIFIRGVQLALGGDMNSKTLSGLGAFLILALSVSIARAGSVSMTACSNVPCVAPTNYFVQAQTYGPLGNNTDTGLIAGPADSTNPIHSLWYDSTTNTVVGCGSAFAALCFSGEQINSGAITLVSDGGARAASAPGVGQLHAAAGPTVINSTLQGAENGFAAGATASYGDTLLFSNQNAGPTTITTIGFTVSVHGSVDARASGSFTLAIGVFSVLSPCTAGGFCPAQFNVESSANINVSWVGPANVNQTLPATFSFIGPLADIPIEEVLSVAGQYGYADFSDTATFSFDALPPGVSYTSASGDFLTATPLPAALPSFATGLGGLGLLGWRRKRKARAVG